MQAHRIEKRVLAMKAIYFPFTDITESTALQLAACCDQTLILRPGSRSASETLVRWEAAGTIRTVLPFDTDQDRLEALVADYRTWAEGRAGGDWSFLKSAGGDVPFFGETSVAHIRSEIRGGSRTAAAQPEPDPVFGDRLFLRLAEAFDRHQSAIATDLEACRRQEAEMLTTLMGDDSQTPAPVLADPAPPGRDPGSYMTRRRLGAWRRLAENAPELQPQTDPPILWLTTSRAVFDELIEDAEGVRCKVISLDLPAHSPTGSGPVRRQLADVVSVLADPAAALSDIPAELLPSSDDRPVVRLELAALEGSAAAWPMTVQGQSAASKPRPAPTPGGDRAATVVGLLGA
jgi:hypothetical protein